MQKSFLMLAMSFVFGTTAQAQDWEWTLKPQFYIKPLANFYIFPQFYDGMLMVQKDAHEPIGFVNQRGELAVLDTFDYIIHTNFIFKEGLAPMFKSAIGEWGFIDKTGKWAIEPQFSDANFFWDGFASAIKQGLGYGFIDKTGQWIIQPQFDEVRRFSEGLAAAKKGNKWGFINQTGQWIIQPDFEEAFFFSEGLAEVKHKGKIGAVDSTGNWAIQPIFENIGFCSEGLLSAQKGNKWGFIDKTGKWVISPQFDWVYDFEQGIATVQQKGKIGFIDKTGKFILQPNYEDISDAWVCNKAEPLCEYSTLKFLAAKDKYSEFSRYGIADKFGKIILPAEYESLSILSEDLIAYRKTEKSEYKIIHKNYPNTVLFTFEDINVFSEGLAAAKKGDKWGFVDTIGKWVIPPQFEGASAFVEGLGFVINEDKYGAIDKTGKWIIQPQFDEVHPYGNGLFGVVQDKKLGFVRLKTSK